MIASLILLLSPFVQLGVTYYTSVASAMFVLGVITWWRPLAVGFGESLLGISLILFMPLTLMNSPAFSPVSDRLWLAREVTMLVFLLCAIGGFRVYRGPLPAPSPWLFAALAAAYLVITWLQSQAYLEGRYLGFPREWFAQDGNTIATEAALLVGAEVLRPTGTFQEPSYLGFILLSMALMLIPRLGQRRVVNVTLAMILIAGLLSRSLAFFLSMLVVILFPIVLERGRNRVAITLAMLVVAIPVVAFSGEAMLSRLSDATSLQTADDSTADRIFGPLYALPGYLLQYPAGNPISIVDRALTPFLSDRTANAGNILNNAFFNLLFAHGFVGIAIIAALMALARDLRTRLYLVTCSMFSGAFLAIDKIAIVILALAVYEANRRIAEETVAADPAAVPAEA